MITPGSHTYQEIISQPLAWIQALEVTRTLADQIVMLWNDHPKIRVLLTGCGSTYYLSLAAAALFQELTGKGARAVPAGDLFLYPDSVYEKDQPVLLVAISRSGTTSETIAAVRNFKKMGSGPVIVITNSSETPLANLGDLTIAIPAGREESVAQTRSFASMYIASTALAAQIAGRDDLLEVMTGLPATGERIMETCKSLVRSVGENLDLDRFYFLGSGLRYGMACEANLKMKEMTLTHSEPFHFLEFRHGPMSMVGKTTAVIGLQSSSKSYHEQAVLKDMGTLGGNIFSLGESGADLNFSSNLPEVIRNVLYLPPLQLMAFYRSLAKGLNPDQPQNLTAVVRLDLEK
jgi:glucosamine--fructose-6-phosphate aminotransferase (isomerizing)